MLLLIFLQHCFAGMGILEPKTILTKRTKSNGNKRDSFRVSGAPSQN